MALLNHPDFAELDFSSSKSSIGGGMAVQKRGCRALDKGHRLPVVEGYGLTETSPALTCNPADITASPAIGLPVPSTDMSILDDDGNGAAGRAWRDLRRARR